MTQRLCLKETTIFLKKFFKYFLITNFPFCKKGRYIGQDVTNAEIQTRKGGRIRRIRQVWEEKRECPPSAFEVVIV